jgi:hypothetical protein
MKYTREACWPLAQKVYQAVIKGEQTMPPGKPRTLRQICGKDFWSGLTVDERRYAGRLIAAGVRLGLFTVKRSHRDGSHHWRYLRQPF